MPVSPRSARRAPDAGRVGSSHAPVPQRRLPPAGCTRRPTGPPLIALVFTYDVADPAGFERAYGPEGEWARFFGGARGYVGTELLRDVEQPGRYLVIDRWESRETYNDFVETHRDEYMRRVDDTVFHYERELRIGTFESAG